MTTNKTTRIRSSDEIKEEFSRRMLRRLGELDMTQADLARRSKLSKDAISTYARQRSLPSDENLARIAKVLRMDAKEVLPKRLQYQGVETMGLKLLPDGNARLVLNCTVPMDVAIEIIQKCKAHEVTD